MKVQISIKAFSSFVSPDNKHSRQMPCHFPLILVSDRDNNCGIAR